jgi:RNA polymerase sigma factor (sigma-70 family)
MAWKPRADRLCARYGWPPTWLEEFEQQLGDAPPTLKSFEAWGVGRLTDIWAGRSPDEQVGGELAAHLVQRYLADSARVLAYRYRLAAEEWEDLVAASAERALRVFSERHIESPQPYLFRTVQRAIWEYLRKARREVATEDLPRQADPYPDPERSAAWRELMATFREHCYDKLTEADRQLIEDLEIRGLSAADAGEPLGLGANAVNVRKFRIRKRLRDCLVVTTGMEDPLRDL